MVEEKHCLKCGRLLPLANFYAHKTAADGHKNECKKCTLVRTSADRRHRKIIRSIASRDGRKVCSKCNRRLPYAMFRVDELHSDGYRSECRDCQSAQQHQYWLDNGERCRERMRARASAPANKQARKDHATRHRMINRQKNRARSLANTALENGVLRKEPCYFCGSTDRIEMHHPDYSLPFGIYWLCKTCHSKLEGMLRRKGRPSSQSPRVVKSATFCTLFGVC